MDFLINYTFDENDIQEILNANQKSLINNVILNKKNVVEIIEYLLELGINNETIKKLFIYQIL